MKAIARALINAVVYLDLADEDGVSEAKALQALEEISYNLSYCTEEEKAVLRETLQEMHDAERENQTRPAVLEFLETFMSAFGLEDPDEDDDLDLSDDRINLL